MNMHRPLTADAQAHLDKINAQSADPMHTTDREKAVLTALKTNHFGYSEGDWVWADCINDADQPSGIEGNALSGVCASLSKKGLIVSDGSGREGCVYITAEGLEAIAAKAVM